VVATGVRNISLLQPTLKDSATPLRQLHKKKKRKVRNA
jgi:hypothetical protein